MRFIALVVSIALWSVSVQAQTPDERLQQLEGRMLPLLEELFSGDGPTTMTDLRNPADIVREFNAGRSTAAPKPVVSLEMDPYSWRTRLNALVPETAAIAFCAESIGGLRPCADAATYLRVMTAQCSRTVLALIDLDTQGDVPLNLFQDAYPDPGDPNFIMLKRRVDDMDQLSPVRFAGSNRSPDATALLLCPEESDSFGHVFRFMSPFQ